MGRCETADGELAGAAAPCQFTMMTAADRRAIAAVVDRVTLQLEQRTWPAADVTAVQLALTEAVANAIRHGCRDDVTKCVECTVGCGESDEVVIVVRDQGSGFDPGDVPDPLDGANTFRPSGRGIFLMRAFMDDVVFADGGREVLMRKRKTPGERDS